MSIVHRSINFSLPLFSGTRSTSVIDVKSKNFPKKEEEDEETEGFDFFKEEKIPDVISQFSSFKSQEAKKETEEEESDVDPLGVLKYAFFNFVFPIPELSYLWLCKTTDDHQAAPKC